MSDVLPPSVFNAAHGRDRHAKLRGNGLLGHASGAQFEETHNRSLRELREVVLLSAGRLGQAEVRHGARPPFWSLRPVCLSAVRTLRMKPEAVMLALGAAALRTHVGHVVPLCSQEEVRRVHAGTYVAAVENRQSTWYRPVREFPREPVGVPSLRATRASEDGSVAVGLGCPCPQPAPVRLLYTGPKPLLKGASVHGDHHKRRVMAKREFEVQP